MAQQWQRSVYGEAGPDYRHAVQTYVSSDLAMLHVRPADFIMAIYVSVIWQLEPAMRQFEGLDEALSMLSLSETILTNSEPTIRSCDLTSNMFALGPSRLSSGSEQ
jgi:hypothetical protein